MARMHARRRGKSSSVHPLTNVAPPWVQYSKDEVIELVTNLAKEGKSPTQIGLILRDQHGIPSVKTITGKSIMQILKEKGVSQKYPEDLLNLMRKAVNLRKHLELHKRDKHNKRALQLTESKIKRLVKYYKKTKVLPSDWFYDPAKAALIIRG